MSLHNELIPVIEAGVETGETSGEFSLNIVFREIEEDSTKYFVAECVEIPGCISEGDTKEEAQKNIEEAMKLCVSVMIEDCMNRAISNRHLPDLRGVSSQARMHMTAPQLQFS